MFPHHMTILEREVETLVAAMQTHAALRDLFAAPATPDEPPILKSMRASAPSSAAWRVYDHCAGFTRLYAIYEQYVRGLLGEWLKAVPGLYAYGDLPEAMQTAHRVGVAEVLQKWGGDRYAHLTERRVIEGLYDALSGQQSYLLLTDAFFVGDQNFRADTLATLFRRMGLGECLPRLNANRELRHFFETVRSGTASVESELKSLVSYRNVAAHERDVDEIVSVDEFENIARFVICLCKALQEIVSHALARRLLDRGDAEEIGSVVKHFSNNVVVMRCPVAPLTVGDNVILLRKHSCFQASVMRIEIDHASHDAVAALGEQLIGVQLSRTTQAGAIVIRLRNGLAQA